MLKIGKGRMNFVSHLGGFLFPAEQRSVNPKRIALWALVGVAAYASMLLRVCASPEGALYWGHCGKLAAVGFFLVAAVCFVRFACCGAGRAKGWFIALSVVVSLLNVAGQALDASASLALFYASAPDAMLFAFRVLGGAVFFYAVFCLLADIVLCAAARQNPEAAGSELRPGTQGRNPERPSGASCPRAQGKGPDRANAAEYSGVARQNPSPARPGPARQNPEAAGSASSATYTLFGRELTLPLQLAFIVLCWLPYLIVFFPGSMPTDTARQLAQWFGTGGVPLSNHFPYLTTVLYGAVYSLGNAVEATGVGGMLALTALQYALGLVAFGLVLLALRKVAAPKWLMVASTVFVALMPIIPTYVVSISKDYLHALCVAVFCAQLLLLVLSRKGGKNPGRLARWWAIALVALLVCLTRNNGVVVAGVGLLAAAVALRSLKGGVCLVAVMVAFLCWNSAVLPACNVQPTEPREALSIPAQVVARSYAMGYEPAASDAAVLAECTSGNPQDLATLYNPRISDPAKGVVVAQKSQVVQYVGAALDVAAAHPGSALAAALSTTYGFWYPGCLGTYWAEDIPYYSDDPWSLIDSGWFAGAGWAGEWNAAHGLQCKVLHAVHLLVPGRFPSVPPGNVLLAGAVRAGVRPAVQGEQEGRRGGAAAAVGPVRHAGGRPLRIAALHVVVYLQPARGVGGAVLLGGR